MKRKRIIGLCAVLAVLLLFPIRSTLKDGGTVEYRAVLYSVQDVHRLASDPSAEGAFLEGTVIRILGMEVFNSVPADGSQDGGR